MKATSIQTKVFGFLFAVLASATVLGGTIGAMEASAESVQGDVVTLEPGLYRHGYGGVRLEDLALVTADGCENLTSFPYDLTP